MRRWLRLVLLCLLGDAGSWCLHAQDLTLSWKVAPADKETNGSEAAGPHQVLYFDQPIDAEILQALASAAYRVLGPVPGNGLLVSIAATGDAQALRETTRRRAASAEDAPMMGVSYAASIPPEQKISPLLELGAQGDATFLVEFHPDVDLDEARQKVLARGVQLQDNPDLGPHRLLVRRRVSRRVSNPVHALARLDEVAYIFPASEAILRGTPSVVCPGAITEWGSIGQYIATVGDGWDGPGQGSAQVSFRFAEMTAQLSAEAVQGEIARAMAEWAKVADIQWSAELGSNQTGTIDILFGTGAHGDPYPFDGPGNILAHTFYPSPPNPEPIAGDMHFDEAETWRIGASTDLFSVALHELGHALGLAHSDDPDAVMYPYYRVASTLADDDREAILRLYAPAGSTPSVPEVPELPEIPDAPEEPEPPQQPEDPEPPVSPEPPANPDPPVQPIPQDGTSPALTISSPGSTSVFTSRSSIVVTGTANDAGGLASVTWASLGRTGAATIAQPSHTVTWSMEIPLLTGINRITIRATDLAGNTSWRSLVVRRQ